MFGGIQLAIAGGVFLVGTVAGSYGMFKVVAKPAIEAAATARTERDIAIRDARINSAAEQQCRGEAMRAGVALDRLDRLREELRRETEANDRRILDGTLDGPSPLDRVLDPGGGVPIPRPPDGGANPGVPGEGVRQPAPAR